MLASGICSAVRRQRALVPSVWWPQQRWFGYSEDTEQGRHAAARALAEAELLRKSAPPRNIDDGPSIEVLLKPWAEALNASKARMIKYTYFLFFSLISTCLYYLFIYSYFICHIYKPCEEPYTIIIINHKPLLPSTPFYSSSGASCCHGSTPTAARMLTCWLSPGMLSSATTSSRYLDSTKALTTNHLDFGKRQTFCKVKPALVRQLLVGLY